MGDEDLVAVDGEGVLEEAGELLGRDQLLMHEVRTTGGGLSEYKDVSERYCNRGKNVN